MYLYIYCEWLDSELVKRYLPNAKKFKNATLEDHKVAFVSFTENHASEAKAGGCQLESAPGQLLYGVLYEVSEEDVAYVDKLTRVEYGSYERRYLEVTGEDGHTYSTVAHTIKNPIGYSKPSEAYMNHMIAGAKEHGFPEAYVNSIEGLR